MDLQLKNKTVLVTGSSKGIGRAIATLFLQEGAKVVITGRNDDLKTTFDELSKEFGADNVLMYKGDLTKSDQIKACIDLILKEWKKLDIVIANIGSGKSVPGLKADMKEWDRMLNLNLLGAVELTNKVMPIMEKQKTGSIVYISSIAGMEPGKAPLSYSASKAGLVSFAKGLSNTAIKNNIRVNVIAPGNIKFKGGRWEEIIKENPKVLDMIKNEVPMQRFGTPEEIASVAVFLASEKASFINGACFVVDGGQTRGI